MSNDQNQQRANGTNGNNRNTALVMSAADKRKNIEALLVKARPSWAALLPSHIKPDVMLRSVMAAVSKTPELIACDPGSIVMSVAQACALGLPPNTPLGLSYLVPFKGTCQLIPGYRGLIRLAVQSGEVQSIESRVVYSRDAFEIHMGTDPRIDHSPSLEADRGEMIGVYSVAKLKTGATTFEWMSIGEINAIRDRSKAKDDGPWRTDYAEMARKTVVRRHGKYLPCSEERFAQALQLQAAAESGTPDFSDVIDVVGDVVEDTSGQAAQGAAPPTRTEAMKDRLATKVDGAAS